MADVLIAVEITTDVAAKIRFMAESGLFNLQTGNATLNFHEGILKSIKTEVYSYPEKLSTKSFDTKEIGITV